MNSLNNQTPATKNQITNNKPSVKIHANVLDGFIANSINGGMIKTVAYRPIMAGTRDVEYRIRLNIKMLTPKTPAYQALKCTLKAYFVPNSRVWTNSEKFVSQKGGSTLTKIKEIPNLGGHSLPFYLIKNGNGTTDAVPLIDTELWRDTWASSYFPKYQTGALVNTAYSTIPKYSVLPFRGFKAIYNDFERNKEYDQELTEYKGDTVTNLEFYSIFYAPNVGIDQRWNVEKNYIIRGKRQNSYYTDYRTEMLGEDIVEPISGTNDLITITEWEKKVAEMRSEAENAQLNDWDIIAKIRGSKKLSEGKVQLLGKRTFNLQFGAVNQSTYNINPNIEAEFQAMGTQGAYSYTEIDTALYQMQEFNEDGYIHVIMQVSADNAFETGFERTGLNVGVMDIYRPDLKELKHDVLYEIEKCGTRITGASDLSAVTGFKRKFSENFKLPNVIAGDMTTGGYYATELDTNQGDTYADTNTRIQSQRTFQYFEIDDKETHDFDEKDIWKDYTDLLINKNQAVMNQEEILTNSDGDTKFNRILGQNQIFFVGIQTAITDLPIDQKIKENYTEWGEK